MVKPDKQIVDKIRMLVAEASAISPSDVKPEGKLRGYGLDSARVIDLIVAIEEDLGVSIQEGDLPAIQTVEELAAFVEEQRRK